MTCLRGSAACAAILAAIVSLVPRDARGESKEVCAKNAEDAQSARASGKLTKARGHLLVCSKESCPKIVQVDCVGWLAEINQSLPSVVFGAKDQEGRDLLEARVLVDRILVTAHIDGAPVEIDPGRHEITFEAPGHTSERQVIVIGQGQKERAIVAKLSPLESSPRLERPAEVARSETPAPPYAAYLLGGAGVVALGAFGYFEIRGHSDLSSLKDGCGRTASCAEADVSSVRTTFVGAGVSLGVGIVLLGVATGLFLAHEGGPSSKGRSAAAQSPVIFHF